MINIKSKTIMKAGEFENFRLLKNNPKEYLEIKNYNYWQEKLGGLY